ASRPRPTPPSPAPRRRARPRPWRPRQRRRRMPQPGPGAATSAAAGAEGARPWFEEWFDHDYLMVDGHRDARDAGPGADLLEHGRRLGWTYVTEARRFEPPSRRLIKEIEIQDGSRARRRMESVLLYRPEELEALLAAAGLTVGERFGDLAGALFDPAASPRLV